MRLFIAADLPPVIKATLVETRNDLAEGVRGVKWVEDHNLHLTFKFLGEVNEPEVGNIIAAMQKGLAQQESMQLALSGLGLFPGPRSPRVVWVGLAGEMDRAESIGQVLDESLRPYGFEPEKARKFHLTLGRVKGPDSMERLLANYERAKERTLSAEFVIRELVLYRSELTRRGPIYTPLEKFGLISK